MNRDRRSSKGRLGVAGAAIALAAVAAGAPAALAQDEEPLRIAFLSYAVANTYDEPMQAAIEAAAAADGATVQVFDANYDANLQATQLQDAVASGEYDGILVQPIQGAGLVTGVEAAIAANIPVGNVDQILGADMTTSDAQVEGLSANVVFVPSEIGRKMGELTVQACAELGADPCEIGYIDAFGPVPLDITIRAGFDGAVSGSPVTVVATGVGQFNPAAGQTAAQDMLTGQPGIDVIVGSDQAITGALGAIAAAELDHPVHVVGYGGGKAAIDDIAAGKRYATVMQMPATQGTLATEHLIEAIRTGAPVPGIDPVSQLPDAGVVTAANAADFTPEWPG